MEFEVIQRSPGFFFKNTSITWVNNFRKIMVFPEHRLHLHWVIKRRVLTFCRILRKCKNFRGNENNKLPVNNSEILSSKNHYNEIIMNGLRTSRGIDIKKLNSVNHELDFDAMMLKWPQLTIKNEYLKLKDNDFILSMLVIESPF